MPFHSPHDISSVVIAGAGRFGLEVYDYLTSYAEPGSPPVAGFIDDTPGIASPPGTGSPILGSINNFYPADPHQVVVVAIGSVDGRKAILSKLWARGVVTPPFVAFGAMVSPAAQIGRGVIICPFTIVNRTACIGDGALLNVHCSIGHGAKVGPYSVLCPFSALNGDAATGDSCFLGTRATIYPYISIGDDCIVDSHTGVRATAGNRQLISSRGEYLVLTRRM